MSHSQFESPHKLRKARTCARGVTLLELMAVIVIIGIFAALAAPALGNGIRDSRALRAAYELTGIFNRARFGAGATGAAYLIRFTVAAAPAYPATASFEVRAARVAATGTFSSTCQTPTWNNADSTRLDLVNFATDGSFGKVSISAAAGTAAAADYCITPSGTVWLRQAGIWQRPAGSARLAFDVVRYDEANKRIGLTRTITIGSSGVPFVVGS